MRGMKIAFPVIILGLACMAFGQNSGSSNPPSNVPPQDVIVPWRHFGPQPDSTPKSGGNTSQPQTYNAGSASVTDSTGIASDAASGSNVQITEEDISKKHPHPPEELQLPAAAADAAPLGSVSQAASDSNSSIAAPSDTVPALSPDAAAASGDPA
jgi:hypothetical protein